MVRPVERPMARKPATLEDLREEFLAHCEARDLSDKTLEWYEDRTRRFVDWCAAEGIQSPSRLRWSDLERSSCTAAVRTSRRTPCTATRRS
jgi:hypothetical protein